MAESLKESNKAALLWVVVGNLVLFHLVGHGAALLAGEWQKLAGSLSQILPTGFAVCLIGILNAQLSSEFKARIVFLRCKDPLPGCRAFTRHVHEDARIDVPALQKQFGPLPSEPRDQNVLWYRLYLTVASDPSVAQVHKDFLFARDYACLAVLLFPVLAVVACIQFSSIRSAGLAIALLFLQAVLSARAARVHGCRLVTTVLALKSHQQREPIS